MSGAVPPFPNTPPRRGAQLKKWSSLESHALNTHLRELLV